MMKLIYFSFYYFFKLLQSLGWSLASFSEYFLIKIEKKIPNPSEKDWNKLFNSKSK